jgi:NhaP-type Na+/H+ or K+/H+ antiporter
VYWIKKIFNDEILVLNITIISCYGVFFVAEYVPLGIHMSGILSLVSLSLFMSAFGRTRISREADKAIHEFWEYVVYACETVIFLMAGIIVAIRVLGDDSTIVPSDYTKLFALWGLCMVGRFLAIAFFMPFLTRIGYGLNWREVIVLTYGGLRGAVGITFALIVAKDGNINDLYSILASLPEKLKDIIIFQMSGVAVLTLALNGTTIKFVVRALGLSTQSIVREKIFADFLAKLDEELELECKRN